MFHLIFKKHNAFGASGALRNFNQSLENLNLPRNLQELRLGVDSKARILWDDRHFEIFCPFFLLLSLRHFFMGGLRFSSLWGVGRPSGTTKHF